MRLSYALVILAIAWIIWATPFLLSGRLATKAAKVDRRARWGIVLQGVGYSLLWQARFWERSPSRWRAVLSLGFLVAASLLAWSGARALGRQWRIDAGLNADHQLVMSGPYRLVRHPIYASMLCLLAGTGLMISPWPLFAAATLVFVIGTEIRVRIEDDLLSSRFGDRFREYQRSVPAYVPFVR